VPGVHPVEPFMALAVQSPPVFLFGDPAHPGRIEQLFLPLTPPTPSGIRVWPPSLSDWLTYGIAHSRASCCLSDRLVSVLGRPPFVPYRTSRIWPSLFQSATPILPGEGPVPIAGGFGRHTGDRIHSQARFPNC
jgi:hypothetical protein